MPKPFLFIHIPKTAGTYLLHLFLALDVSQARKQVGLSPLKQPGWLEKRLMKYMKKFLQWPRYGSFIFHEYHTKYYELDSALHQYPCVVAVREPARWYVSYLGYFMHMSPFISSSKNWYDNVATRAKDDPIVQLFIDKYLPKVDFSHWEELLLTDLSAFIFFMKNIRMPAMIKQRIPSFSIHKPIELDYMTCFYIWSLSPNPAKILNQPRDAILEYFESQSYMKDMGKCFFIHQENLLNQLRKILVDEMDYSQDIVDYTMQSSKRVNWMPTTKKSEIQARTSNDAYIQDEINNSLMHYYRDMAPKLND